MNGISHRVIPCGLILGLVLAAGRGRAGAAAPAEVNPFIGTGGKGFGVGSTFPGPCVPFGMARPGPDPAKNIYVRSVTLNGKKLEKPWFKHEEIAKGGELVFEMSEKPTEPLRLCSQER